MDADINTYALSVQFTEFDIQMKAKFLIEFFGPAIARDHVIFVLSPEFGIRKGCLKEYWTRILIEINHQSALKRL